MQAHCANLITVTKSELQFNQKIVKNFNNKPYIKTKDGLSEFVLHTSNMDSNTPLAKMLPMTRETPQGGSLKDSYE